MNSYHYEKVNKPRRCPNCGSTNIQGGYSVVMQNKIFGKNIQTIRVFARCLDCGFGRSGFVERQFNN